MRGPIIYAARSAERWHRQHREHQDNWTSAAWGLVTAGVLATGTGIGSMIGAPDETRYPAFTVTLFGMLLIVAAYRCWRRSHHTPPPTTPRYDEARTVPVDRWDPKRWRSKR